LRCILVVGRDFIALKALTALARAGFEICEIWTGNRKFPGLPSAPFIPPFSAPYKKQLAAAVRRSSARPRLIERPIARALDTALAEAPEFDVLVCAGSEIIFPGPFLERLRGRAVNFHPALLPHYKGPLPIHALLIDGMADLHGGMTLHLLEAEIDAGPILAQRKLPVSDYASPGLWIDEVIGAMEPMIAGDLVDYLQGRIEPVPQPPGAGSYFSREEVRLDAGPGQTVERVRAYLAASPALERWAKAIVPVGRRERSIPVKGEPHVLGAPTGAPPEIRMGHIEFDALDARIVLRRLTRPERMLRKMRKRKRGQRRSLYRRMKLRSM